MTSYKSTNQVFKNPVQIGFNYEKLHHWERDKPDWFRQAYEKGKIQVTSNSKESYVTVHNTDEETGKISTVYAYENDWVIINSSKIIFVMPDSLFQESFKLIEGEDMAEETLTVPELIEEAERALDMVNNPPHYTAGGIECIDYLKAKMTPEEYCGFLKGNVIKYMSRANHKGSGEEDIRKAKWYQDKLVEFFDHG
jgi:hypothetical protein